MAHGFPSFVYGVCSLDGIQRASNRHPSSSGGRLVDVVGHIGLKRWLRLRHSLHDKYPRAAIQICGFSSTAYNVCLA